MDDNHDNESDDQNNYQNHSDKDMSSVAGGSIRGGGVVASSFACVDDNHDNESDDSIVGGLSGSFG